MLGLSEVGTWGFEGGFGVRTDTGWIRCDFLAEMEACGPLPPSCSCFVFRLSSPCEHFGTHILRNLGTSECWWGMRGPHCSPQDWFWAWVCPWQLSKGTGASHSARLSTAALGPGSGRLPRMRQRLPPCAGAARARTCRRLRPPCCRVELVVFALVFLPYFSESRDRQPWERRSKEMECLFFSALTIFL